MRISRKRFNSLEERLVDLEVEFQSQQDAMLLHLENHEKENEELKMILEDMKKTFK